MLINMQKLLTHQYFLNCIFLYLLLIMIFTRSFVGIQILGFRLGELMAGFGLLLIMSYILYSVFYSEKYTKTFPRGNVILLFLYFIFVVIATNGSFLTLYTYKSSSFLWMIGYFFLGLH